MTPTRPVRMAMQVSIAIVKQDHLILNVGQNR